jgi:hypothetical protein
MMIGGLGKNHSSIVVWFSVQSWGGVYVVVVPLQKGPHRANSGYVVYSRYRVFHPDMSISISAE